MSRRIEARLNARMGRRSFLRGAGRYAVGGAAVVGIAVLGIELSDGKLFDNTNRYLTDDQITAKLRFEQAQRDQSLIRVEVVNSDDPRGHVELRKNPAILYDNKLKKVWPEDTFDGILVGPVPGLQQTDEDLSGPWVGVKIENDKIGFIHNNYVRRLDGQLLAEGQEIYDLRPNEPDIVSPIDQSQ